MFIDFLIISRFLDFGIVDNKIIRNLMKFGSKSENPKSVIFHHQELKNSKNQ